MTTNQQHENNLHILEFPELEHCNHFLYLKKKSKKKRMLRYLLNIHFCKTVVLEKFVF